MKNFNTSRGFTLIEALVTVIVMSIGLLGLAALQNTSVQFAYDSFLRTQSSFLAYDLFDRMRANPTVNYNLTATTTTKCNTTTANCAPTTIMQYDIVQWRDHLNTVLPAATPTISAVGLNPPDSDTFIITFKWNSRTSDGNQVGATDNRQEFSYTARIR